MSKIQCILNSLEQLNLDALFLVKKSNVNYISAFTDEAAYVLISKKGNFLITDGRFVELAEKLCNPNGFKVLNWNKYGKNLIAGVTAISKELCIKRLGFERASMTFDMFDNLGKALETVELVPTSDIVENLRYVKNEKEISLLREAGNITDKSFQEILEFIKPGMTETEVAAKLEYIIKLNGGDGVGFETILISGAKTSLPHGKPDNKIIEVGDFITLDFGALYKGYTADMTRTIVIGKANPKQLEVYNLVKEAQQAGMEAIKDGVTSKHPDDVIRKIVAPYIEYYYPGIGHGVGLDLHEQPFLGINGDRIIKKNCVITVEPGLYIPNWGGVRIEDSVLVLEEGVERFNNCTKDLISL
ncbi:MAG: Xaa-Pro peptidase family protein [Clostridium sp.]